MDILNKLTSFSNFGKKGLSVILTAAMLAGPVAGFTSCDTGNTVDPNPGPGPGPGPGPEPGPDVTVQNISFTVAKNELSSTIISRNGTALTQLKSQSTSIRNQYAGGANKPTQALKVFFGSIWPIEDFITTSIGYESSVNETNLTGQRYSAEIIDAICVLIDDTQVEQQFRKQVSAFQVANYLGQRKFYDSNGQKTTKENQFNALCHDLETVYGQKVPFYGDMTKLPENITALKGFMFGSTIPIEAGEGRANLIQQLEDFSQLNAWVDDLINLNYPLTSRDGQELPDDGEVMRPEQPISASISTPMFTTGLKRSEIQTANGIFK
jgi:hypothetical protein